MKDRKHHKSPYQPVTQTNAQATIEFSQMAKQKQQTRWQNPVNCFSTFLAYLSSDRASCSLAFANAFVSVCKPEIVSRTAINFVTDGIK